MANGILLEPLRRGSFKIVTKEMNIIDVRVEDHENQSGQPAMKPDIS